MTKDQYGPGIAQTDLFANLLGVFICLFTLTFLMIAVKTIETKQNKVESKAEFLITMTWPDNSNDDVDLYVEDPNGNLVFFRSREKGLMHLDRDDLGFSNDTIVTAAGETVLIKDNREIVTIRGIIPGEYTVNCHMFHKRETGNMFSGKETGPTTITAKVEKINPALKLITQRDVVLSVNGDEKTFFRFQIDKEGDVTNVSDLQKELAVGKNEPVPQAQPNPEGQQP